MQVQFTNDGIKEKQRELYDLSDEELLDQAIALQTDSKEWLSANFDFSSEQLDFLNGLSDSFFLKLGSNLSLAIINRTHIKCDIKAPPSSQDGRKHLEVTVVAYTGYNTYVGEYNYVGVSISLDYD